MTAGHDDPATLAPTGVSADPVPTGNLSLLVIGEHAVATHVLPDTGSVTIGRSSRCDILVDDSSVSRRHAVLHLGARIELEDLGSINGTCVRGERLGVGRRVALTVGEPAVVGALTLILQQRSTSPRPRRIWPHGYFEGRLEEECLRARRSNRPFTVMRILGQPPVAAALIEEVLAEVLRQVDVVGCYSPGDYEALLVDATATDARTIGDRVLARLVELGGRAGIGIAQYAQDGLSPDELISRAGLAAGGGAPTSDLARPLIAPGSAMDRIHHLIARVAPSTISVLILGETGVGKELLAETIHRRSTRADRPFLRLNCAALSESLIESELFGHERGAFTGAVSAKEGLLETADLGTVFLDEVGDLPLTTQTKLLRVIEERLVTRVGGLKPRAIDVRFVAATNRDLDTDVGRGSFRQDLYFRLNGITLTLPPLRERVEEIEGLANLFLAEASRRGGRPAPRLTPMVLTILRTYSWPGNIRELRNAIERAALLCAGDEILVEHLPMEKLSTPVVRPSIRPVAALPPPTARPAPAPGAEVGHDLTLTLERNAVRREAEPVERERIAEALRRCGGNQTQAAVMLGISRRTLINRLESYGIERPRKRKPGDDD